MRAVVQRVSAASVEAEGGQPTPELDGILVYLGVAAGDGPEDAAWLAAKVLGLRIFEDGAGVMNRSVLESGGGALVISQFTLLADARRGARISRGRSTGTSAPSILAGTSPSSLFLSW